MKNGAHLLLAEPVGHVGEAKFAQELAAAAESSLQIVDRPVSKRSSCALLKKV
jgi:hypothetical protein